MMMMKQSVIRMPSCRDRAVAMLGKTVSSQSSQLLSTCYWTTKVGRLNLLSSLPPTVFPLPTVLPAIQHGRAFCTRRSLPTLLPMKPGTILPGLNVYPDQEPVRVLEREEYPAWVEKLTQPAPTLAVLRKMSMEEASDADKKRFVKLTRRMAIRQRNERNK